MLPDKEFFKKYAQEKNIPWQDRNILLEYLQTQILKALSLSKFNDSLSFLGGTCLRFAHGINRFSEDLDFDLLKKEGFNVENVLREFGISAPKDEKILIKFEIDFDPYKNLHFETKFSDSFNERFPMLVNTLETLFAQKILAIIFHPYQKGRDFYDLVWFLSQKNVEPNYAIFKEKGIDIKNRGELIEFLKLQAEKSDLPLAVKDVERFLFFPEQAQWILKLPEYLESFKK